MIRWDKKENVLGYTVVPDHDDPSLWAILPRGARFRRDDKGRPICNGVSYRKDGPGDANDLQAGFFTADIEYAIPPEDWNAVAEGLSRLKGIRASLIAPSYTRATASVQLLGGGSPNALVQELRFPASPALYGNLGLPIAADLTDAGATILHKILMGQAGQIQAIYEMRFPVRMPDMTVHMRFDSQAFLEFHQLSLRDEKFWPWDGEKEFVSVSEAITKSESRKIDINPGTITDQVLVSQIREAASRSLDEAIKRIILPDLPEISADDRKAPEDLEFAWRNIKAERIQSYQETLTQGMVIEMVTALDGATLPSLTGLTDLAGQPIDPAAQWQEIDLDDSFFKRIQVRARANADFANLPIDSVELKIAYPGTEPQEFSLRNPDDVVTFEEYRDGGSEYTYSYQVNYRNQSRRFDSAPATTDDSVLTINVGDTGVLNVDVVAGNLDHTKVASARVDLVYEDPDHDVPPVEQTALINAEQATARIQRVVFAPVNRSYRYRVTYQMLGGQRLETKWKESTAPQLVINDPFSKALTVTVLGEGDFETSIETIFLTLNYDDPANNYSQSTSMALSADRDTAQWAIPVIDRAGGHLRYSGYMLFKDGRPAESIPEQTVERAGGDAKVIVGEARRVVEVLGDLVDMTRIRLAKLSLRYEDPELGRRAKSDFILKQGSPGPFTWTHPDRAGGPEEYTATIDYFLTEGGSKRVGPITTSEETFLIPEVPVA